MPILGQSKFNWEAPHGKPQFLRWEETACINFEGNGNNDMKKHVDFMLDWLGQESSRILELHNGSLEDKQNKKKIINVNPINFSLEQNILVVSRQAFILH